MAEILTEEQKFCFSLVAVIKYTGMQCQKNLKLGSSLCTSQSEDT